MFNYFISLLSALQSYRASHAGLSPDAIVIGEQTYKNLKEEVKLIADSYEWKDDEFENISIIVDEYESLWRFEGVAPLEHIRCCLCNAVLDKNYVSGHNLDDEFVCETCYNRIKHNLPSVKKPEQKIIESINEMMKSTMNKDYLKVYGEILFGEQVTK